jgi:hypothetical protein
MGKIEKLTAAQEQELVAYHTESMRIGTCCDPADKPRAENAIGLMYEHVGKKRPTFVWCESPAGCSLAIAYMKGEVKGASLWGSLGGSLRGSLWDSLEGSLRDSLRGSLRDSLRASLGGSLWGSLGGSLRGSLWDSLWDSLRASLWASLGGSYYGQQEQSWIAFYTFAERIGVPYQADKSKHLGWWRDIAESCCWWTPYENICFVSNRPAEVHINDRRVLHNESGPAMLFRDGWPVWAIDGVHLGAKGEQIVMRPESQTVAEIRGEGNEEIRRIRIERFGWLKYLKVSGAKLRDQRFNERDFQNEELYSLDDGSQRISLRDPSTGRRYALGVPAEIKTCEAAQNWLSHDLDKFAVHRS